MTRHGDLALLDHPVAQRLLQAPTPAQFAYTWLDGTPTRGAYQPLLEWAANHPRNRAHHPSTNSWRRLAQYEPHRPTCPIGLARGIGIRRDRTSRLRLTWLARDTAAVLLAIAYLVALAVDAVTR